GAITMMQYTIFHYNHIALSEFLCVTCLVTAWYLMTRETIYTTNLKNIFLICFTISLSWYFKFQFLYLILWPFIFYMLIALHFIFTKTAFLKEVLKRLGWALLFMFCFGALYYIIWYLPSKPLFDFVMDTQASAPFGEGEWFWKMIN